MAMSHFVKHLALSIVHPRRTLIHSFSPLSHSLSVFTRQLNSISTDSSSSPCSETSLPDSLASPYLSVSIRCRKDVSDMLSEALLCFGASSASVNEEDVDDGSDEICITSIFSEGGDVDSCISHASDSIGLTDKPSYEIEKGEQVDWVTKTQESFLPTKITEELWIVPAWRSPIDNQATHIILNPGLAFGTGEHPTTKLCLLLLHGLIKGGELVLDYGTGSGILAIAALKFGAASSVGFDVDPQAITSARQNADLNNITRDKLQLHLVPNTTNSPSIGNVANGIVDEQSSHDDMGAMSATEKYDVVIANILLNPLLHLSDHIVSYAKPGAVVALSGVISEQVPSITGRYSELLESITVSEMDDWACVSGTKKKLPTAIK